tara:strand:+ start:134 stop:403 length:270 start_codon:yes stop_codon:yes gene_type:complete
MINKKESDLDKDGKLTSYEKKRGMAIAKAMKKRAMQKNSRVKKAIGGVVNYGKNGKITISESKVMSNAPRAQVKGFGAVRSDVKNFRKG